MRWQRVGPQHWELQPDFPVIHPIARAYKGMGGWTASVHHKVVGNISTTESQHGFATAEEAQAWATAIATLNQ